MAEHNPEIKVEQIHHSGVCGNVDNISETAVPSKIRQETNCTAEGTHQVWRASESPEDATIVCACNDHIEEAKEYFLGKDGRVENLNG